AGRNEMGTSQSSSGSPSGVPMVPPWVPDPVAPDGQGDDGSSQPSPDQPPPQGGLRPPSPIAPPSRFGSSRTSLGRFASSGSDHDMRSGVGHYVGKGYGGAGTA